MFLSVLDIIKKLESYENIVYVDSLGNKTIGYGFNLDDPLASEIFETVVNKNYDKYSDFVSTFDDIYYGNIAITEELAHDKWKESVEGKDLSIKHSLEML